MLDADKGEVRVGAYDVEKLYKVLIVARTGTHPFIHDLLALRKTVEKTGLTIPICSFPMERLIDYAGNARYDGPNSP